MQLMGQRSKNTLAMGNSQLSSYSGPPTVSIIISCRNSLHIFIPARLLFFYPPPTRTISNRPSPTCNFQSGTRLLFSALLFFSPLFETTLLQHVRSKLGSFRVKFNICCISS
ncbi:hypothetical protein ACMFMG_009864 [Clarireedia jacksonii]